MSNFEQTLSIIKPDAVKNNNIGEIVSRFENEGLRIVAAKLLKLSKHQAEESFIVCTGQCKTSACRMCSTGFLLP